MNKVCHSLVLKCCTLLVLVFSLQLQAASTPDWVYTLDQKAQWSQLSTAGTLLVGTKSAIQHIDTTTGKLLWRIETDKELAPFNIHDLGESGYLLISEQFKNIPPATRLRMYELMTGELVWETPELLASNLAVIPDPERGQMLFVGAFPGSPKDKTNGTLLRAYDIASGEIKFQIEFDKYNALPMHKTDTAGFFSYAMDLSGHARPIIDGNHLYLSYRGLTAVNLDNGEVIWDHKFKTVDGGLKNTTASPVIDGDLIFAAGQGNVVAINRKTGALLWDTKVGSKYALPELQVLQDQVVVRIGGLFSNSQDMVPKKPFGVASLDKVSGAKRWVWKQAKDSITNMQVLPEVGQVVVADKKNLYRLSLAADKKANVLEKRNLEFKRAMGATDTAVAAGKVVSGLLSGGLVGGLQGGVAAARSDDRADPPSNISAIGDSLIVRGNYHVLSYSPTLNSDNWSISFSPPGVNGMLLALSGATMALTAVGNAGMHTSMSARNRHLESSLGSADKLGKVMTMRYAAAAEAGNLGFFLTKAPKESGANLQLMGINLASGGQVGEVPIEEKEPVFTVDNLANKVYYFHKEKEVRAFGF